MSETVESLQQRLTAAELAIARLNDELSAIKQRQTEAVAPFRVRDEVGNTVLEVLSEPKGSSLRLLNASGQTAVSIGVDGTNCGYLAIRNAAGVLVGYLSVEMAGARLLINDNQGEHGGGVVLYTDDTDGGGINVLHKTGSVTAALYSDTYGGVLDIYHAQTDRPVVMASATPDSSQLTLTDKDGEKITVLP